MLRTFYIPRDMLEGILSMTRGRMFTVEFQKKDGSMRRLNGRMDVRAHQKGGKKTSPSNYLVVWEAPKPQEGRVDPRSRYRNVNLNSVRRIRVDGVEIQVT